MQVAYVQNAQKRAEIPYVSNQIVLGRANLQRFEEKRSVSYSSQNVEKGSECT